MILKKDAKYTFNINMEEREKFKMYCKLMKVSPSELLGEVILNFNADVDRIIKMKEVGELQEMMQGKFAQAQAEIDVIKANKS